MGWPQKLPIVSLLLVVAFVAVPLRLAGDRELGAGLFESARGDARTFLVRNPQLEVDTLGSLILDPTWLQEMRYAAENVDPMVPIQLPPRILARSQASLDAMIADAYALRIRGDPAWRFGVLGVRMPARNYVVHAFVHDNWTGIVLSVAVLLLVGIALELTWGPLIFSAFVLAAIPLTAQAYRLFDASSGIPWSGGTGLAGALIGAYFIRGLGGHFYVPGWILLPAWLTVESFVVRDLWLDNLGVVPWATICAAVGIGALAAGALRLANLEPHPDSRVAKRVKREPDPVVARAARLRSDGDPHQAFELMQAAWREDPKNDEIIEAFFVIAVDVGQPEAAAAAIVPSLEKALRSGDLSRAVECWLPIAEKECDVELEATVAVRLGEALLDAGHPREALFTLRSALAAGVSAAQATRIVNVVRDLDDELARQAASIALEDATLDLQIRAELEAVATIPSDAPPLDSVSDVDLGNLGDSAGSGASDPNEARLQAQALDSGALSAESLSGSEERDPLAADITADLVEDFGEDFADRTDELQPDPSRSEVDLDRTPLIDATDEMTMPLVESKPQPNAEEITTLILGRSTPASSSGASVERPRDHASTGTAEGSHSNPVAPLRSIRVLDAIPIAMGNEWVEIDASPRGKSKVPFSRIQTISMVAVDGLGSRPVLVIDILLNGSDGIQAPMKLIRFRSDRFDPLVLEPEAASPLLALLAWVKRIQAGSDAICLPSNRILSGKFSRFDSLEAYERQVLTALRADF